MDIIIPYYRKDNGGHDLNYTLEQAYNNLKEKGAVAWGRRAIKEFSRLSMELTMKKRLNVLLCEAGEKEVRYRFKVTEMWQKGGKYDLAQIKKYLPAVWGPDTKEHTIFFKVVEIEMYKNNKKLKEFIDIDGNPVTSVKKGRTDYVLIKDDPYPALAYDPEFVKAELKKKELGIRKKKIAREKKIDLEPSLEVKGQNEKSIRNEDINNENNKKIKEEEGIDNSKLIKIENEIKEEKESKLKAYVENIEEKKPEMVREGEGLVNLDKKTEKNVRNV